MAGSDSNSDANVSTLALNPPNIDESSSNAVAAPMEVHWRNWYCLNLFRPPYVCGQCYKTCGACLVRGVVMALSGLFFLSLFFFPVLAHWMWAMALSGLFS